MVTQLTITQKAYREGIWPLPAFDYPQILRPALEQNHEVYERIYSIERLLTLLEENLSYRESVSPTEICSRPSRSSSFSIF